MREFAHDPLTSNDEEKGNKKTKGVSLGSASWGLPEFDQHKVDEKMLENLAINGKCSVHLCNVCFPECSVLMCVMRIPPFS